MRSSESGEAAHNPLGLWKGIYCNILSRLNILHKHHYEDVILNPVGARFNDRLTAESYHFTAMLRFLLFRETHICQDWYSDGKGRRVYVLNDSVRDCSVLACSITRLSVLYGNRSFDFSPGQKTVTIYKRVEMGSSEKAERTFDIEQFFRHTEKYRSSLSPEDLLDSDVSDMMNVCRGKMTDFLFDKEEGSEFKEVFR